MDADIPITLHSASATNMRVDFTKRKAKLIGRSVPTSPFLQG
jgi:hypothetical protein